MSINRIQSLFLSAWKNKLKITFSLSWNLHWKSMHGLYSICYITQKIYFFCSLKLCHLTQQPFLVRVPIQWKRHTPTDYNSTSWLHAVEHRKRMIFTLGDCKRNLDKFLVLADARSLSDSAITVFLCSRHVWMQLKRSHCLLITVWTTSHDCVLLNTGMLQTSVHVVYLSPYKPGGFYFF